MVLLKQQRCGQLEPNNKIGVTRTSTTQRESYMQSDFETVKCATNWSSQMIVLKKIVCNPTFLFLLSICLNAAPACLVALCGCNLRGGVGNGDYKATLFVCRFEKIFLHFFLSLLNYSLVHAWPFEMKCLQDTQKCEEGELFPHTSRLIPAWTIEHHTHTHTHTHILAHSLTLGLFKEYRALLLFRRR